MLEKSSLELLKNKKNLLAFSAGGDSTALAFLLLQNHIKFDIAIVDYAIREQSKDEVRYANELCSKNTLISNCHIHHSPKIKNNFEAKAREIRYDFFNELIEKHKYENLLTAHHLGDRFEWAMMQFCKGSGCAELAGMKPVDKRKNYTIIRPLLHIDKSELLEYLNKNNIKYFEDESNNNEEITRNEFRHNYTKPLLKKYLQGIKKSFEYIDADREILIPNIEVNSIKDFAYFKQSSSKRADIFAIDKYLKSQLHIPTAKERELLKTQNTLIIGRKFIINFYKEFVFIAPFKKYNIQITKEFKEICRILKIEPKLREYLFLNEDIFLIVKKLNQ